MMVESQVWFWQERYQTRWYPSFFFKDLQLVYLALLEELICMLLHDHKWCLLPVGWSVHSLRTNVLRTSRIPISCRPNSNAGWLQLSIRGDNWVIDKDLKKTHRTVLPLCIKYKAKGKTAMKHRPITVREKKQPWISNYTSTKLYVENIFYYFRLCEF